MRMLDGWLSAEAWAYFARSLLRGKNPLSSGLHPDMNTDEGHLGGYIRGRQSSAATSFAFEHGDPLTWTPDLWRWAYDDLGVRSVLDIGCCEVVEHVRSEFVDHLLRTFCAASGYLMMTYAGPGQPGHHHVRGLLFVRESST